MSNLEFQAKDFGSSFVGSEEGSLFLFCVVLFQGKNVGNITLTGDEKGVENGILGQYFPHTS